MRHRRIKIIIIFVFCLLNTKTKHENWINIKEKYPEKKRKRIKKSTKENKMKLNKHFYIER